MPPLHRVALLGSPLTVMRAERLLKGQGLAVKAIPLPPHISSDCGICLRFQPGDESQVKTLLGQWAISIVEVLPL